MLPSLSRKHFQSQVVASKIYGIFSCARAFGMPHKSRGSAEWKRAQHIG
jgi:hypothetical protein